MAVSSPKGVENTVEKGKIAHYEQFLIFPQRFLKTCTEDTYKPGLVWEWVNKTFFSFLAIFSTTQQKCRVVQIQSTSNHELEAFERLYRSTGLIFLQWQKKFLTIIIQSLHFSSLKKKGMEKTCEKRRKKW